MFAKALHSSDDLAPSSGSYPVSGGSAVPLPETLTCDCGARILEHSLPYAVLRHRLYIERLELRYWRNPVAEGRKRKRFQIKDE